MAIMASGLMVGGQSGQAEFQRPKKMSTTSNQYYHLVVICVYNNQAGTLICWAGTRMRIKPLSFQRSGAKLCRDVTANDNNNNNARTPFQHQYIQRAVMKPVRGSSRPLKLKNRNKPGKRSSKPQEPDPATVRPKSSKKASGKRKNSGQDKWQPLTRSSIAALQNILDLSVLTCLNLNRREKEETRKHLNILKNRLQDACAGLRVPPVARRDYEASPGRLQEESRRSLDGKKTLSLLKSDLDNLLAVLEDREEERRSLEQSCSSLRHQLEEEQAVEMMQLAERGVLRIPVPPKIHKYTTTLQAQLRSLVPGEEEAEKMARKLGDVLFTSEPLQDARHLLAKAGHCADLLLSAGPTRPVDQTQ